MLDWKPEYHTKHFENHKRNKNRLINLIPWLHQKHKNQKHYGIKKHICGTENNYVWLIFYIVGAKIIAFIAVIVMIEVLYIGQIVTHTQYSMTR